MRPIKSNHSSCSSLFLSFFIKNNFNLFLDIVAVQQNTSLPPAAASPATHMEQATTSQNSKKPRLGLRRRPTIPPKPQLLHHCEICNITCAGPQVSPVPA